MYGTIPNSSVTFKALLAYRAELAVAASIVLGPGAGTYGVAVLEGTILTQQNDGTYLPAAPGDAITLGKTKVLGHTVTCDGRPTPGIAGYYTGFFNKAALIGTPAQIAALGVENEPGVIHMQF
jgi:hypothetical protein